MMTHTRCRYRGLWQGLEVAVKTIVFSASSENRKRALQEAALCQSIGHPNIVATYAVDVQPIGAVNGNNGTAYGMSHSTLSNLLVSPPGGSPAWVGGEPHLPAAHAGGRQGSSALRPMLFDAARCICARGRRVSSARPGHCLPPAATSLWPAVRMPAGLQAPPLHRHAAPS